MIDNSLLTRIFNELNFGMIICDMNGFIIWFNQPFVRLLPGTYDNILMSNIKDFFPALSAKKPGDTLFIPGYNKEILICDITTIDQGQYKTILLLDISSGNMPSYFPNLNNQQQANTAVIYKPRFAFDNIIGENRELHEIIKAAKKAANTSSPVLIYGETGTGKELIAQSIHNAGFRAKQSFVTVNCAAIPENLLEGILFGTVQGAFTEAVNRPGLFEQASQGTIFLDEINSMPISLQAKLLRVLQEKTIRRVGGLSDIYVNPKIISSVNIEPLTAVANGMLRSDLFFRLGVICLHIPPLRERKDDIPQLADFFMKSIYGKLNKPVKILSPAVISFLQANDWPGNVRQLEHAIECAINFADDDEEIAIHHFPKYLRHVTQDMIRPEKIASLQSQLDDDIQNLERSKIMSILEQEKGNITETARILGISRQSLYYRMRKFSLSVNRVEE